MPRPRRADFREGGSPDTDRVLRLLADGGGPNPPNQSADSLHALAEYDGRLFFVDEDHDTSVQLLIEEEPAFTALLKPVTPPTGLNTRVRRRVQAIYFLPRADWVNDNMADLTGVMGYACADVLRLFPEASPWLLYGDFQGAGDTDAEKAQAAADIAQAWADREPGAITFGAGPYPSFARGYSTVGFIARTWGGG